MCSYFATHRESDLAGKLDVGAGKTFIGFQSCMHAWRWRILRYRQEREKVRLRGAVMEKEGGYNLVEGSREGDDAER
jgi:hypothetical protein